MKIELHMIQSFAPSCLNRDDTNAPKDCVFGGSRRARISSQCLKRAIRWESGFQEAMAGHLATRSLRFPQQVFEELVKEGVTEEAAKTIGSELQKIAKKETQDEDEEKKPKKGKELKAPSIFKTPQIVFYTPEEVRACALAIKGMLDAGKGPKDIIKAINAKNSQVLPKPKSVDVALFGRMITSDAFMNVDAACQVAHAISTHKVDMEFDYFTAVDDLQPKEDAGAGMIGTVGFNSACFYRYAVVDFDQLKANLSQDAKLSREAVGAFLRASVQAVPTGKQNTFAAHNPPSFVLAVVRKGGAWNLANAFEKPVFPRKEGLVEISVGALDAYYGKLAKVYGSKDIMKTPFVAVEGADKLKHVTERVEDLDALVEAVLSALPEA